MIELEESLKDEINFMLSCTLHSTYVQLYCPIPTQVVGERETKEMSMEEFLSSCSSSNYSPSDKPSSHHYSYDEIVNMIQKSPKEIYDIPTVREQERLLGAKIFANDNVLYLCEYIPRNWHKEYYDERSEELILRFKDRDNCTIEKVADILEKIIPDNYVLIAVPPGTVEKNGTTAVHLLIKTLIERIGESKNIIDASEIIYRKIDKQQAHLSSNKKDRSLMIHYQTLEVNEQLVEKISGKNVLILDDITTTGSSFKAMKGFLRHYGVKNMTFFSIGKTVDFQQPNEIKAGFIINLDGTLFNSDTEEIKNARDNGLWGDATRLAYFDASINHGVEELITKITDIEADYTVITTSKKGYAQTLLNKSSILKHSKLIADIPSNSIVGFMQAKQLMKIYDPSLIVIANSNIDIETAHKLNLITVQIGHEYSDDANYHFDSIQDLVEHFADIFTTLFEQIVELTVKKPSIIDESSSIKNIMTYLTGYDSFWEIENDFLENKERYYSEKNNISDPF